MKQNKLNISTHLSLPLDAVTNTYAILARRLRTMGIIDYPDSGKVKAEPFLFLE